MKILKTVIQLDKLSDRPKGRKYIKWLILKYLTRQSFNTQNLTRFTLRHHFKWPAANLAIRRKSVAGDARIYRHRKSLAAVRALDVRIFFHARI